MKTIYLDNNATTKIASEVLEAMLPYFKEQYFNPSSQYDNAKKVFNEIQKARITIASFINASDEKEIIFTSCATESNNAAIIGTLKANPKMKHIITTSVEHPAVLELCKYLSLNGYDVSFIPVDKNGNLDIDYCCNKIREDTVLVSVMHANNETGVIFPIDDISKKVKEIKPDIIFHSDATQSVGKIRLDMGNNLHFVDMITFSGHKFHAPKGIGCLYIRKGTPWLPFLLGGHQENGQRAGTENTAYIIGLMQACLLAEQHMESIKRIEILRNYFEEEMMAKIPYIIINGREAKRLQNTSNISFYGVESESILNALNQRGIYVSAGSACTSGTLEPSHVLKAMKVPDGAMHGTIRFSLSRYTNRKEIDSLISILPEIIHSLRKYSSSWNTVLNRPREI